jgi:sugar fermentation stimulation protein A
LAHVHDPGRLREILYPGNRVVLKSAGAPRRKTAWDVIAGRVGSDWVLVHSGYHRGLAERILRDPSISPLGGIAKLEAEVRYGHSRLDFRAVLGDGTVTWVEVKGCTLTAGGAALFPDAPTVRGRKHLHALTEARSEGAGAALLVLVLGPEARCFAPNEATDPAYTAAFREAVNHGVEVYPLMLSYDRSTVRYHRRLPLCPAA